MNRSGRKRWRAAIAALAVLAVSAAFVVTNAGASDDASQVAPASTPHGAGGGDQALAPSPADAGADQPAE